MFCLAESNCRGTAGEELAASIAGGVQDGFCGLQEPAGFACPEGETRGLARQLQAPFGAPRADNMGRKQGKEGYSLAPAGPAGNPGGQDEQL